MAFRAVALGGGGGAHAIDGADHTGILADAQIPGAVARDVELHAQLHAALHAAGQTDELLIQSLGGVALDGQIPGTIARDTELHAELHSIIGAAHNGFPGGTANFLRADGTFAAPPAGGGGVAILNKDATLLDIVNTSAETTLYTFSVPGGTLGTNNALRLTLASDYLNNSGAGTTYTLRVKYGATTLFDDASPSMGIGTLRRVITFDLRIFARGQTDAQGLDGFITIGQVTNAAAGQGEFTSAASIDAPFGNLTCAEDSTLAKNLTVTIQHSVANANLSLRRLYAVLEHLA